MTGFLVTSVLLFAVAARCLVLWLNARSFSAFRSAGLYLLIVSGLFATGTLAFAQPSSYPPASALDTPFLAENLGRAYVAIDGAWAFHPGDNLAWAAPGLDDRQWTRIQTGRTWEEQGFRNYNGYAWYRRRIVVDPQLNPQSRQNWKLVLYLPAVQNAAEVYWNGRLIGSYGKLPPDPVWYDAVWPLGVAIVCPSCGRGQFVLERPESGVLAIRVWTAPYVFFSSPNVGGLTATPELGSAEAIRDHVGRQSSEWLEGNLYTLGLALVSGIVAVLALLAWLRDRRQWMLFWLAIYTVHAVLLLPFSVPGLWSFRLGYGLIAPVVCAEDVSLWFLLLYLLNLRDDRRLVRWTLWMTAVAVVGDFGDGALQLFQWTTWPGHRFLAWDIAFTIPALLVESWVLVLVAFAFRRKLDTARWLLAIAAMLADVLLAVHNWGDAGARWTHWTIADLVARPLFMLAGNAFNAGTLADTLLLVAIVYAVWRYQVEQSQRQNHLDEEFRSAQEVQRVLVPESLPEVQGYAVASVYKPALEVGGDFFQIIPCCKPADSALLVVGDVSGKGLKAAMTVSLIVGALRALADTTTNPAEVLAGLNRRLHEHLRGGFATCIAVRLDPDGRCLIANAGHPAPYRNGVEVHVENGLPLGVVPEITYPEVSLQLAPGDTLAFVSDGVVEAQNSAGELFGFERTRAISPQSAEAIAAAAQAHGQEDDITVVTVEFWGRPCPVPAEALNA